MTRILLANFPRPGSGVVVVKTNLQHANNSSVIHMWYPFPFASMDNLARTRSWTMLNRKPENSSMITNVGQAPGRMSNVLGYSLPADEAS